MNELEAVETDLYTALCTRKAHYCTALCPESPAPGNTTTDCFAVASASFLRRCFGPLQPQGAAPRQRPLLFWGNLAHACQAAAAALAEMALSFSKDGVGRDEDRA
jgi:hypothetical protein